MEEPKRIPDPIVALRKKEGQCIKCGKEGHCIVNCPVKGRAFLPEAIKGKKEGTKTTEEEVEGEAVEIESEN